LRSPTPHCFGLALLLALLPGGLTLPQAPAAEPTAADAEFFEKEVRPLLVEKCWKCHGETTHKGRLKLTTRASLLKGGASGPAAVPEKPEESLLIDAVRYKEVRRMPPDGKLTARQIAVLERWVKLGVPWPGGQVFPATATGFTITEKQRQFWSFQPLRHVAIPAVDAKDWVKSDVDRFILAALEAKRLTPAKAADKRTLLRRATFDLTGLPPTPGEIDAFLEDASPQAFAKVVDRLLASPRYGERWGRHWLDVVRYADARDLIQLPADSDFREAWRYRDWVVDAFNRDLPYKDFVRLQVAGDLLPPLQPGGVNKDGLVATGMLAIADFIPGDVDKEQMIADYVNDQIDVVSRGFLGLSLSCARCHDHKFDPIGTEDYYALAGIFFSTRLIPGPVAGNTPLVRAPLLSPTEIAAGRAQEAKDKRRQSELEQQLSETFDHFGEGLVRTPNDFGERGERPTHPALLDYLAARFIESGWSVKAMHRLIMLSSVYQQSSRTDAAGLVRDAENRLFGRMNRQRLDAEAIRDSLLAVAGILIDNRGGPPFADIAVPRRTLYLQSARTGANTSDFGRLFDRADPGSIVAQRGQSASAPQALFFLNDKFVTAIARQLAARVVRQAPQGDEARMRFLYTLVLGRPPTRRELDIGIQLLSAEAGNSLERYCHLLLCTNEFLYLD
jgi:hypothetical protein